MKKIKIILADDHGIVRAGIRHLLESQPDIDVVAEAEDGHQAVQLAESENADIVIMDIAMPHLNGIEAAAQVRRRRPETAVIILSVHDDEEYLSRALAAGVRGYLLKDSAQREVVQAVQAVASGKAFFSPAIAHKLAEDYSRQLQGKVRQDSYDSLTDREKEILQLVAEGKTTKEIAALLNVSPYTVETHRTHIMHKLSLRNTAELVLYAVRKKIVS